MSKIAYHISLKGYVGGFDFDRSDVDAVLAKNEGKRVNVLIDSLGGFLATGLSISAAFKNHGNVNVHFVGLNASAATIASLGAAHISIDARAMYIVHKCSMALFSALQSACGGYEWGSLNSDQFATLIADCEKIKTDLDKLDLNVAQLYAKKCRKPVADLLALMKVDDAITTANAVDIAKEILFSFDPRLRSQDLLLYCSQDFVDKYNDGYRLTHGGIPYNTQYGQGAVEGSNGKLKFCPLYNKAGSKFMHVTSKSNMLVGCDQMGDVENVMVKEYAPFILSYIATMFFGVQFETLDKRRFKTIEITV